MKHMIQQFKMCMTGIEKLNVLHGDTLHLLAPPRVEGNKPL